MLRKKYIQNTVNIAVFFICICILWVGSSIASNVTTIEDNLKLRIEEEWREQAARTLTNIRNKFIDDMKNEVVNPNDEYSLQEWAKHNIAGVLNGGATGDAFMINLVDEKFIWDGSPDCARPEFVTNGRYLKDESALHEDPEQAEKMINKIRVGGSTLETYDRNWWNFDGSPEYLEWTDIPSGPIGFNGESRTIGGVINTEYSKVMIVLGTQEDEVQSTFKNEFKNLENAHKDIEIFMVVSISMCILNLLLYIFLNKKSKN